MSRILLSTIHYPLSASRYLYWALRRMGHEVVTIGPAAGAFLPWANGHNMEPYEWKPDIALNYDQAKMVIANTGDALARLATVPDLIIQMDANFIMDGKAPCPNVLYAIDNHCAPYGAYDTFDKLFLAHSWGFMHELPQAEWLPCGYDPQFHYVIDEDAPQRFQAALVGNGYPARVEIVKQLTAAGVRIQATTGLIYDDYNRLYNQAQIAICQSITGDVAMRIFENMAQGCLVVCDRAADLPRCGFVEGVHYLGYDTPEDCVRVVTKALHNWGTGLTMVKAAREAVRVHTWQARAEHILKAVNLCA